MKKELDEKLVKEYPTIFKNRYSKINESCMAWGFECGAGWYSIIDCLCRCIVEREKNLTDKEKTVFPVVADQVKEKFGELRFYFSGGDEVIEGMVDMATELSRHTCEDCGNTSTAKVRSNFGWLSTLCDTCAIKE